MCMVCGLAAMVLLTLAAGYIVLLKADKAEGNLKQIGKVIGWVIIVVSAAMLIWSSARSTRCAIKGSCGYGYGKCGMNKCWHKKGKSRGMGMKDKKCCPHSRKEYLEEKGMGDSK